jgi:hypothetical protein
VAMASGGQGARQHDDELVAALPSPVGETPGTPQLCVCFLFSRAFFVRFGSLLRDRGMLIISQGGWVVS